MLALIVLNYNSYDDTKSCVERLMLFNRDYRIIIVDNCSTDCSYERLQTVFGHTEYVDVISTDHNGGYGAGNNHGISFAIDQYEAETIGILNPDVEIPDAGVIDHMHKVLYSDESFGIVGGRIIEHDGSCNLHNSAWSIPNVREFLSFQSLRTGRFNKPVTWNRISEDLYRVDCVAGCFFLAKTECMRAVGMFDENMFLYYEEILLGIKCRNTGYKEILVMNADYYHNHRAPDNSRLTLKAKLGITDPAYRSAQYLCRIYYGPAVLVPLWLVERINKIILFMSYIKYRIIDNDPDGKKNHENPNC